MYYTVRHVTRFRYSAPISESIMEVRLQPRSEGTQRCLDFRLSTGPRSHVLNYRGENNNRIHHFDIPNKHSNLTITAEAIVEVLPPPALDELSTATWSDLDAVTAEDEYWDSLQPSHYARPTQLLHQLMEELNIQRKDDPLTTVKEINTAIYMTFEYAKENTQVDSPIDDALRIRSGVCQDFAHIMIAMVREVGIPCRYVSGYLFHQGDRNSNRSADGATHAWVEALIPGQGWIGFDPTNNSLTNERHIRVAIGRDYSDVPPTHGIFRGSATSELSVNVRVHPTEVPPPSADLSLEANWVPAMNDEGIEREESELHQQPEQQQQQ